MMAVLQAAARPVLLLSGLIAAGVVVRLLPEGGAAGLLTRHPSALASWHALYLMVVGAGLCAVGLPRQIVCYACGAAFGAGPGLAVALAAQLVGCIADLVWARLIARDWVARRLPGRLARLDAALAAQPFAATLTLRLLPVGNNLLLNLAAGLSSVATLPFLAASALGYIPQTLVFTLAGSGVQLGRGGQLTLAVALMLASGALGTWLLRRRSTLALSAGGSHAAIHRG